MNIAPWQRILLKAAGGRCYFTMVFTLLNPKQGKTVREITNPAGVSLQSSHIGDRVGFHALRAQIGALSRRRREPWLHPRRNAEAVWLGRQSALLDRRGLRGYHRRPAALWVRVSIKR